MRQRPALLLLGALLGLFVRRAFRYPLMGALQLLHAFRYRPLGGLGRIGGRAQRGRTAEAALEGFSRQLKKLPKSMRTSLTYDRGTELTCDPELMDPLDIDVWFADPHAPWQRGSNENTNGLLRQCLPKGIDLSSASQAYLNHVAMLMNTRPRQTLGWKTPAEVMDKEIAEFRSRVALAS